MCPSWIYRPRHRIKKKNKSRVAFIKGRLLARYGHHGGEEEKRRQRHSTGRWVDSVFRRRIRGILEDHAGAGVLRVHFAGWLLLLGEPRGRPSHLEPDLNLKRLNQHHSLFALSHATGHFQRRRQVLRHANDLLAVGCLNHKSMRQLVQN